MELSVFVERFIQERKILHNVSPATLQWYRYSFRVFAPVLTAPYTGPSALRAAVIARIAEMKDEGRGNKAVSINTYLRCFKAFLNWAYLEKILPDKISIAWLKEEQTILSTFTADHITRLVNHRPETATERRVQIIALAILDTGMRISEALGLTPQDVDLDNLVLRLKGKGSKERLVPLSLEFRKHLYRYMQKHRLSTRYVFGTMNNNKFTQREFLRDFKVLGAKLGITGVRVSPHTLRHTFAVQYLRAGGNLEYLRRILGHSDIATTQKYLRSLGVTDLVAVHNQFSVLGRR